MPVQELHSVLCEDKTRYGFEWARDGFDCLVDNMLAARYVVRPASKPFTAVDIGCGTGRRAHFLSALGVFDEVIAIDIADRSADIEKAFEDAKTALLFERDKAAPIRFRRARAQDLNAEDFDGLNIGFINFRNVAHFMQPSDLRRALDLVNAVAHPGAMMAFSFDHAEADFRKRSLHLDILGDDPPDFYARRTALHVRQNDGATHTAAYGRYSRWVMSAYLTGLGMRVEDNVKLRVAQETGRDTRDSEALFLAYTPTRPLIKISPALLKKEN